MSNLDAQTHAARTNRDTIRTDVAVIGAGSAGLVARRQVLNAGRTALLIDPGPLGTTCARVGCMPSKLLIAAADAAQHAREAAVFGVDAAPTVDGRRVMQRVRAERDRFVSFVLRTTDAAAADGSLLPHRARFVDDHTLELDDGRRVEAGAVVVATGSSPWTPPPFRPLLAEHPELFVDNEGVFDWQDLPASVLVVGAGVIGLELGQALHRLGVRTTIVDVRGTVGILSDPKIQAEALRVFTDELDLHARYTLHGIEAGGDGVVVRFDDSAGAAREETYERVLLASGRRPNTAALDLPQTTVPTDERGHPVIDPYTLQAGEAPIFFAGDVTGDRPLLHEAADGGRLAGRNAAVYPDITSRDRKTMLGIAFTDPQMAVVGQAWSSMDCDAFRAGFVDFGDQGRSRVMNQHRGFAHVYGQCGSGLLVGAELVGPRAEHLAHLLAWAIERRMTVDEALAMPFYHPVVEEGLRTALRDLAGELKRRRQPGAPCETFGPGD